MIVELNCTYVWHCMAWQDSSTCKYTVHVHVHVLVHENLVGLSNLRGTYTINIHID